MHPLIKSTLVILLVVVGLMTLLWLGQRRLIYFPHTAPVGPAAESIAGAKDVQLQTSDGLTLGAWLVPPLSARDRRLAVLVANGNAGDRSLRAPLATALAEQGFTVLLFDYRGYGGNPSSPTQPGLFLDVRAAFAHLSGEAGFPPDRIILFGESLGTAVVTDLATEHATAGLVLRSPFTDLAAVAGHHYPLLPARLLLRDRYPVAEKLARIKTPVVVVYGSHDNVVPSELSRQVASRAGGPVTVVEVAHADHNDYTLLAGEELIDAVVALADRL